MTPGEIAGLWRLMGQTWGSRFFENYGAQPNEAWTAALLHVSTEVAKTVLQKLIAGGSPFPPTLPEFVSLAKTSRPAVVLRHPLLDHQKPEMSQEQVEARRREMYSALGKSIPK